MSAVGCAGRRARLGAALAALAVSASACATDGLAFRADERVDIVSPKERAEVTLPFTLEWTAKDVAGVFAVLVDQSPQPPGKTLSWFADEDCKRVPGCPDEAYLAQRSIYTTAERSFRIETVGPTSDDERCHMHEATIVLLDEDGRRKGESAWSVEFRLCDERS